MARIKARGRDLSGAFRGIATLSEWHPREVKLKVTAGKGDSCVG